MTNFEKSAQKFKKRSGKLLITSNPPKAVINPKKIVICINIFLLEGMIIESPENIIIGIPRREGIRDVIELLPDANETTKPNATKNIPYKKANLVKGRLKTVNSFMKLFSQEKCYIQNYSTVSDKAEIEGSFS